MNKVTNNAENNRWSTKRVDRALTSCFQTYSIFLVELFLNLKGNEFQRHFCKEEQNILNLDLAWVGHIMGASRAQSTGCSAGIAACPFESTNTMIRWVMQYNAPFSASISSIGLGVLVPPFPQCTFVSSQQKVKVIEDRFPL